MSRKKAPMPAKIKKPLPQPSEPASITPIVEFYERKTAEDKAAKKSVDQQAADYRPTRGKIDKLRSAPESILRAVDKGGAIQLDTLKELLELFAAKTDYHFHVAVEIANPRSALLKTIDNERDAKETIRRLKEKP
jgi:hypothetical protein